MKILVVGAGVIGTIYGWAIAESGHDVTHVVRPGRRASLANGIEIDMFDKRPGHKKRNVFRYGIRTTENLGSESYDLVIVPVHHYELIDVLGQFAPMCNKDAGFLLLTQNWQGTAEIDKILPQHRYLFGDAKAGGTFGDGGGKLIATIKTIDIGQVEGRHDDCLQKALDLFNSASLEPRLQENILHYLWVQYAVAGGLWPVIVRAGSMSAALRDKANGELGLKAARECLRVVERRGVDLKKYPETQWYFKDSYFFKQLGIISMKYMFSHDEYQKRCTAHSLSNPRETRTFYFDLLTTGKELGVPMPVMESFGPDIERFGSDPS